jgi:anion-transporting  ArsA/GET3 family ATPase
VTRRTKGDQGRPAFDAVVLDAPPTGRITQFLQATNEVAGLTKFGPIHKQSIGVTSLLHSADTVVHIVTLLEEMPVQETLDAAAELSTAGYRLGRIIVNRARPELVGAALLDAGRHVDVDRLSAGLAEAGLSTPGLPAALARQLDDYAARQQVQQEAGHSLDEAGVPVVRLPDLVPPLDLGGLFELADALEADTAIEEWA